MHKRFEYVCREQKDFWKVSSADKSERDRVYACECVVEREGKWVRYACVFVIVDV